MQDHTELRVRQRRGLQQVREPESERDGVEQRQHDRLSEPEAAESAQGIGSKLLQAAGREKMTSEKTPGLGKAGV